MQGKPAEPILLRLLDPEVAAASHHRIAQRVMVERTKSHPL